MRLKPQAVGTFLQNPDPGFRGVLLFGPNSGLAQTRANQLCTRITDDPSDPFNVAKLTSEQRGQNRDGAYGLIPGECHHHLCFGKLAGVGNEIADAMDNFWATHHARFR